MSNTIRIKRRATGLGGAPSVLKNAELAFNEVDNVLYYGTGTDLNGDANTVISIGGTGAFVGLAGTQTISGGKTFTGTVALGSSATAATKTQGDGSTSVATTSYVDTAVGAVATSFDITGDSGTAQTVTSGTDTVTIAGGTAISTVAGATDTITVSVDDFTVTLAGDLSGSATITNLADATLTATIVANSVALGTDTTGNYMEDVSAGTGISVSHTPGEGSTATITNTGVVQVAGTAGEIEVSGATGNVTIGLPDDVTIGNDLVVSGDLTVNGTTTTISSTTINVDDKNIELGAVDTPTDTTADGGGLTLKGDTDKTFNW